MEQESNHLLEYTIDTLLKTFNPERKQTMNKAHFFKMMDIIDTNLQKQGIDIGYPKYWYKYGSVAHMGVLDQNLGMGFSRYMQKNNIVLPHPCRTSYHVGVRQKTLITSQIKSITQKYKYKKGYGDFLKKDSYELNSPHIFNKNFQKHLDSIQSLININQSKLLSPRDIFEPLLDTLLDEFPENIYSELLDTHLAWDDTTRLVLDCISNPKEAHKYLHEVTELFWDIYSKAIRIDHNQNIPADIIQDWELHYKESIIPTYTKIENVRKTIIMKHHFGIGTEDKLVKELLQKSYSV